MADLPFRIIVRDDGTAVVERFGDNVQKTAAESATAVGKISLAFSNLQRKMKIVSASATTAVSGISNGLLVLQNKIKIVDVSFVRLGSNLLSFTAIGTTATNKITQSFLRLQSSIIKLRTNLIGLFKGVATRGVAAANKIGASFKNVKSRIDGAFKSIGPLVSAIVGIGAVLAIRKVILDFAAFEKQMLRVNILTGATTEQFAALTAQAKRLGRTTVFTATESADAMAFLAQAGFSANEVFKALPDTLLLAAAAQIDLATSADIVTNILTGLRIPIDQLGQATDVLVQAFISSNTNLQQLGQAFKFVGPIAASAGVSFEETTAILGLLGNAGIQASMAGTTLRNGIVRLLEPSREAAKVIKDLGISIKDSEGKMRSFVDIINQFAEAGIITGEIITIFGARAGPGFAALIAQGGDRLEEFIKLLDKAGNVADRVAAEQLKGLSGSMTRLKSATDGAGIEIGESLAPSIQFLTESIITLTPFVTTFIKIFSAGFKGIGLIGNLFLSGLVRGFQVLAGVITGIASLFVRFVKSIVDRAGFLIKKLANLADKLGFEKTAAKLRGSVTKISAKLGDLKVSLDASTASLFKQAEAENIFSLAAKDLNKELADLGKTQDNNNNSSKKAARLIKEQADIQAKADRLTKAAVVAKEQAEVLIEKNRKEREAAKETNKILAENFRVVEQFLFSEESLRQTKLSERVNNEITALSILHDQQLISDTQFQIAATEILRLGEEQRAIIKDEFTQRDKDRRASEQEDIGSFASFFNASNGTIADGFEEIGKRSLNAKQIVVESFNAFGSAFARAARAGKSFGDSFEIAMRQALSAALERISAESAIQGLFNIAQGIAATANLDFTTAGLHFKAAAGFFAVAALAGAGAGAVGGATGGGGGGGAGTAPPPAEAAGIAELGATETQPMGVSINIQVSGFIGDEAALASALAPVIKEAQGDGVNFGLSGV